MSALLEPEEDTLIWSAWVLLKELSLAVLILHTNTASLHGEGPSACSDTDVWNGSVSVEERDRRPKRRLQDSQDKFLSIEDATAPRVGRSGTGINWRLQVTRELVALK